MSDETITYAIDQQRLNGLLQRVGLVQDALPISAPELGRQLHDRKLSADDLSALRLGLTERGLLEQMV